MLVADATVGREQQLKPRLLRDVQERAITAKCRGRHAGSGGDSKPFDLPQPSVQLVPTGENAGHHSFLGTLIWRQVVEKRRQRFFLKESRTTKIDSIEPP